MSEQLEVWLAENALCGSSRIGTLAHADGQIRFTYDAAWLKHPACFAIDPLLQLDAAPFFPEADRGNFGIFLDSSPDRWGQMLLKRRETLAAQDAGRSARRLRAWDFLIGVQDETRQGALRFRRPGKDAFLDNNPLAVPPVAHLRDLEAMATAMTNKHLDDMDGLRRWLAVLVAPGASLGGARPKANFRDTDGRLWIAKFPARDDDIDVSAWEMVIHQLAAHAGVNVPFARLVRLGGPHRTFCLQRFDRAGGQRVFYASAMTMLHRDSSEGASYLEMAEFLRTRGAPESLCSDLAQLFRRVLFNVMVSNRDDHLRNHGFILSPQGWRLAPAFDMNPNLDKDDHVLNLNDRDNRPAVATVLETADFYQLTARQAGDILAQVRESVATWQTTAKSLGVSGADISLMAKAFQAEMLQSGKAPTRSPGLP